MNISLSLVKLERPLFAIICENLEWNTLSLAFFASLARNCQFFPLSSYSFTILRWHLEVLKDFSVFFICLLNFKFLFTGEFFLVMLSKIICLLSSLSIVTMPVFVFSLYVYCDMRINNKFLLNWNWTGIGINCNGVIGHIVIM